MRAENQDEGLPEAAAAAGSSDVRGHAAVLKGWALEGSGDSEQHG